MSGIQYADKLSKFIPVPLTILIICAIAILVMLIIALKLNILNELWPYLSCFFAVLILAYFFVIFPVQKDIRNQAYVEYTGTFIVEDYYFTNRSSSSTMMIRFPPYDKTVKFKTIENFYGLELEKEYRGIIVYGKNSKFIIDIKTNDSVS